MRSKPFSGIVVGLVLMLGLPLSVRADSKAEARRYFNRGMAAIDAGRYREGIEQLKSAYAIRPHPNVLFNIGRAYAALGDLPRAVDNFELYLASNPPDSARIKSTLGELKVRLRLRRLVNRGMEAVRDEKWSEGIALLQQAYRIRPHPNLLFNIGRAQEDAGRRSEALSSYRSYLRTKPEDAAEVRGRIAKLEGGTESVAAAPAPASAAGRRRPGTGRGRPPTPERAPPAPAPVPAPTPSLSEADLTRLADAVVDRLEARAAEATPAIPRSGAPAPVEIPEGLTGGPNPEGGAAAEAAAGLVEATVPLEAKGGEAYEEVVVTASRRAQSPLAAPNAVTVLTDEDIRLSGARSVPDLLRRVPGVDVMAMSYSDANVAVRGFNRRIANKVLVLVDNRTVYVDFLGATSWRTLPVELVDIERIEIVRGPGSAVYGAYAYTGIINIITKRPEDLEGATAQIAAGNGEVIEGSFQYGERLEKVGIRITGGYQRGQKYDVDFDASQPNVSTLLSDPQRSLEIARANALLEYHLEPSARLYVGGSVVQGQQEFFGVANLRNLLADGVELHARAGFESELLTVRTFWSRLDKDVLTQSFSTGTTPFNTRAVNDIFAVEPIFRPRFELAGTHEMVLGAEYRFKSLQWDSIRNDETENHFAAYFQDEWRFGPQLAAVVSARLDLHPLIGPLGSPRLAFIFNPGERQALRLSIGTAFRVPTMAETYLNLPGNVPSAPGTAVTLVGREDLDPEGIATVDLGYRIESDFGSFELVGWLNRVTNLIVRTPLASTEGDARFIPELNAIEVARSFYVNEERVFIGVGGEVAGRIYPVDGLDLGGSYAFQYIFDEATGERFTDSPLHKASLWGQLRTNIGLDLGISVQYVSDQEWVEPDFDPTSPTGFDTEPFPLDSSLTLLARLGYRLLDDRLELAVSGFNLLDVGDSRHREHPFANRLEARVLGSVTGRF